MIITLKKQLFVFKTLVFSGNTALHGQPYKIFRLWFTQVKTLSFSAMFLQLRSLSFTILFFFTTPCFQFCYFLLLWHQLSLQPEFSVQCLSSSWMNRLFKSWRLVGRPRVSPVGLWFLEVLRSFRRRRTSSASKAF